MAPIVTLTTDFGVRDPYVAAMKGVILSTCKDAQVVDLTHAIAPQDVLEGAFFISRCAQYFPPGTIHVIVVDPGVGTTRRPLVASAGGYLFVFPDNGVLSYFFRLHPPRKTRLISNPLFMRSQVSATFHGRDVFAQTAGCLARGVPFKATGDPVEDPVTLDWPEPQSGPNQITGEIVHIDAFGNALTNIDVEHLTGRRPRDVRAAGQSFGELRDTYADVPKGDFLVLLGSNGLLKIACREGSAAQAMQLIRGMSIEVLF